MKILRKYTSIAIAGILIFSLLFLYAEKANAATTIYLTSGTTWEVPVDWNNSNNTIEIIGCGGHGENSGTGNGGGGGGGYSKITNQSLTPLSTVNIQIGLGGSGDDTYLQDNSASTVVLAQCGGNANPSNGAGGIGGDADAGVGTVKYDGGTGYIGIGGSGTNGGGGGAAASPSGNGADGVDGSSVESQDGDNGANGTDWDATHGAGGGGQGGGQGGFSVDGGDGGDGGLYGGGGGGGGLDLFGAVDGAVGLGAQGIIVITYTAEVPNTSTGNQVIENGTVIIRSGTTIILPR